MVNLEIGLARRAMPFLSGALCHFWGDQAGGSGISNKSLTRQSRRARPAAMAGVRDR